MAPNTVELVGRRDELSAIEELLDDPPGSLLLEGGPGIGKTTVWHRGIELAIQRGYGVVTATPVEAECQLAYSALRDLFDELFEDFGEQLPRPQNLALSIALLRAEQEGRSPGQDAVAAGCLRMLRAAAQTAHVLVAVDDIQWLDPSSALVLGFVARRVRNDPISFLFCMRSERAAPLGSGGLGRLSDPRSTRRVVGPLTIGALHQLLVGRLEMALPRPTLRAVHELSGGNPFFALEIARALPGKGWSSSPWAPLPVPPTLRGLVATRIADLPRETRASLAAAAAATEPTLGLVAAASGSPGLDALSPAIDEEIVRLDRERVHFTHPLFAAAAYESVAPNARRELHSALSSLVEEPEERARHLALAVEGQDERTAATLEEAARLALARGAPQAAVDLSEQARALTPANRTHDLRRRNLALAEYNIRAGDSGRARELLEQLLAESAAGPRRAEVLSCLGWAELFGLNWKRSHRFHAAALAEPGASDEVRARSELGAANALVLLRKDVEAAAEHARTAVRLAERIRDPALRAEALATRAGTAFLLGSRASSLELIERALSIEADFSATPVAVSPQSWLALILQWDRDLEYSRASWEAVRVQAVERGDETSLAWILARIALLDCVQGLFADAKGRLEEAHEIVMVAGQASNRAVVLAARALVEAYLGNVTVARSAGEEALRVAAEVDATFAERIARTALGFLALSLRDPAEAHAYLESLAEEDRGASIREPSEYAFLPDDIEALIALGRLKEAEGELGFLEDCANAAGRTSAIAAAGRCRALLAAAQNDRSRALAAAREAVQHAGRVELPFERARSLLVLGVVLRRAKQLRAARESFEAASEIFERLGTRIWAERARAELAHIGGRRAQGHELTATERRVAELVAEGLSNREVSSRLFVTQKTVEFHLRNIFRKLSVRSRTELARLLASKP